MSNKPILRIAGPQDVRVEIKLGPVENKATQLFTLTFYSKYDKSLMWHVTYSFSTFKDLYKLMCALSPGVVTTEFPPSHHKTGLGIKLTEKQLQQRLSYLIQWVRETVANYDMFPETVRYAISKFIDIPSAYTEGEITASTIPHSRLYAEEFSDELASSESVMPPNSFKSTVSSSLNLKLHCDGSGITQSNKANVDNKQRLMKVSSVFVKLFSFVQTLRRSVVHTSLWDTAVMSVSRSNRVITSSRHFLVGDFLEAFCASPALLPLLAMIVLVLFSDRVAWMNGGIYKKIIFCCSVAFVLLWYDEQLQRVEFNQALCDRVGARDNTTAGSDIFPYWPLRTRRVRNVYTMTPHRIQVLLRNFLRIPNFIFVEYECPIHLCGDELGLLTKVRLRTGAAFDTGGGSGFLPKSTSSSSLSGSVATTPTAHSSLASTAAAAAPSSTRSTSAVPAALLPSSSSAPSSARTPLTSLMRNAFSLRGLAGSGGHPRSRPVSPSGAVATAGRVHGTGPVTGGSGEGGGSQPNSDREDSGRGNTAALMMAINRHDKADDLLLSKKRSTRSAADDSLMNESGRSGGGGVEEEDFSNRNTLPDFLKSLPTDSRRAWFAEARLAFEKFCFDDISDAARAMYIDRRYTHKMQVRGATYLEDQKKIYPGAALAKLMLLELYEVESKDGDRHDHVASRGAAKERREAIAKLPGAPFQLIFNFQIPGDPPISIVCFFAVPPDVREPNFHDGSDTSNANVSGPALDRFLAMFDRFIDAPSNETQRLAAWGIHQDLPNKLPNNLYAPDGEHNKSIGLNSAVHLGVEDDNLENFNDSGDERVSDSGASNPDTGTSRPSSSGGGWGMKIPSDITWPSPYDKGALPPDDFRNMRFKLVPIITEGPWIVRAAVPSKPALLGRKIVQRYFRGDGYLEIDLHVGSSTIAAQITGVCRGYGKLFAADLGIAIQGEDAFELPEKLLCCASFNKIDVDVRRKLD